LVPEAPLLTVEATVDGPRALTPAVALPTPEMPTTGWGTFAAKSLVPTLATGADALPARLDPSDV
jgi:hypothetical protein